MRFLILFGLFLSLFGFWSSWLGTEGNSELASGETWYVFGASPVFVGGVAAVLILVLASFRTDAGAIMHALGVLAIFFVLCEWTLIVLGFVEARDRVEYMTAATVQVGFFVMVWGQALLLWGTVGAWASRRMEGELAAEASRLREEMRRLVREGGPEP